MFVRTDMWVVDQQVWEYGAVLMVALGLAMYMSVGEAVARMRVSTSQSLLVRLLAWRRPPITVANRSAARAYVGCVLLCQVVPGVTLAGFWVDYPVLVRLKCAVFFIVEAAWFAYLRRSLD
jgi:hypothetical protein